MKTALYILLLLSCAALLLGRAVPASAQTLDFSGAVGGSAPDARFTFDLAAGDTVIAAAEAASGDLDTLVKLEAPDGAIVSRNNNWNHTTLDSAVVYTAHDAGVYTVIVSAIGATSGDFRLRIDVYPAGQVAAHEPQAYEGLIDGANPEDLYPIFLRAGQGLIAEAVAPDGSLDTYLRLIDPAGQIVAHNDDRDDTTLDSLLVFIALETGDYTVVMTNYPGSSGSYALSLSVVSAAEALARLETLRIQFSGPAQTFETPHFRIHFTFEGIDATTQQFVRQVAQTMEEVYNLQINRLGWAPPPGDGLMGGDERYDVYIVELIDDPDRYALGYASSNTPEGDNPHTPLAEARAAAGYLVLDNDYHTFNYRGDASIGLMRATAAHEFNHVVQFGYDIDDPAYWIYEATASWMETITFPDVQDATGYVESVFTYPEVCFGASGFADPAGLLMYGSWLFIQSLADAYGPRAPIRLWEHMALYDGWEALEVLVAEYGDTLEDAVARYHLQNLVRDYAFTPAFSAHTVWLENTITQPGSWTFTGSGIQELAANYFRFVLPPGVYHVRFAADTAGSDAMQVWAVGIKGEFASAIALGSGGLIDTSSYSEVYLMVFNPAYDDTLGDCRYSSYSLSVQPGWGSPAPSTLTLNAAQFAPLD